MARVWGAGDMYYLDSTLPIYSNYGWPRFDQRLIFFFKYVEIICNFPPFLKENNA